METYKKTITIESHNTKYLIDVFVATDRGKRDYQQDRWLLVDDQAINKIRLFVADGMGGHANGDLAAIDTIVSFSDVNKSLTEAAIHADKVCKNRNDDSGSTVSGTEISIQRNGSLNLKIVNIGDSQTSVYELEPKVKSVFDTKSDEDPLYGFITNCIGELKPNRIQEHNISISDKPTLVYIASDGCFEYIRNVDFISTILDSDLANPAEKLVELSLVNSTDNSTCILAFIKKA